jgi:Protein of unknown function (DUF3570)
VAVVAINQNKAKMRFIILALLGFNMLCFSQEKDTIVFKKRVLETTEIDFVGSYYTQEGTHSAVSGGIGTEQLTDFAGNTIVAIPLNDDDILTIDGGISVYTSASSSNINPFIGSSAVSGASGGASGGYDDDDDNTGYSGPVYGTPWQASSGASASDGLVSLNANYSHSSDSRNFLWNTSISFSSEYDYTSFGIGGGITKLFNNKNSEISLKINAYLDTWQPIYATELSEYAKYGANFQTNGYFSNVTVLGEDGLPSTGYLPSKFRLWEANGRNSYSASITFSQVLSKKMQFSLFFDLLQQEGQLSTPYQRVYFADKTNYYIGTASYIPNYQNSKNTGVYRLADDIERLPNSRFKLPIGMRWNYYISEKVILRTYYRYYMDNWDLKAHTASVELPIKLSDSFTVFPIYRYYTQSQSKYFAPFDQHLSTETYYTSDYDLSAFNATQFGFGFNYKDVLAETKFFNFGLKNIDFRFNQYKRSDGLTSYIGSIGFKFAME